MDNNQYFHNQSSEFLKKANENQMEVSQKEFELKLLNIRQSYNNQDDYLINKGRIENEINNLITQRNSNLFRSIDFALQLVSNEINNKNTILPLSYISINFINSFIESYKIKLFSSEIMRLTIHNLITTLQSKPDLNFGNLRRELERLYRLI